MEHTQEDPPERKTVVMPRSMWRDIKDIKAAERIATEAEALRRVVTAGLKALKEKTL
jgi:hypothetical protein